MKDFAVRGLEVHSSRMWDFTQMRSALDFMVKYGLNTLIFHQNDLLDVLVFPEKYFSLEYMWKRFPPRYSRVLNFRYYINNIIKLCHDRGIRFMPEVKELWYDEWILELHPEVINRETGLVCATHPFWWEYLTEKLKELFSEVPGIDGIIVSPGTRESKLSIAANRCGCERCRDYDAVDWYAKLIRTMNDSMEPLGKKLVVRDFAFGAADQTVVLQGVKRAEADVAMSLKNTPHDFYPTFPTNPAIGKSGLEEWVEFDTWGQFIGNGVFPASVIEDMQARMRDIHAAGATGVYLRSDWENMQDHCVFNSLNMVNLIAGAMLSQNAELDTEAIYREWAAYGLLSPLRPASADCRPEPLPNPEQYARLRDFMRASWQVLQKTLFVRGHLFQDNSMFPYSMERGGEIMMKAHCMDEWLPGASRQVLPTPENMEIIFTEKAEAVRESERLGEILDIGSLGISDSLAEDLQELLDLYPYYTRCFEAACRAYYHCLLAEQTHLRAHREQAYEALTAIDTYAEIVGERVGRKEYIHEIPRLLDSNRLLHLRRNIQAHLDAITGWKDGEA